MIDFANVPLERERFNRLLTGGPAKPNAYEQGSEWTLRLPIDQTAGRLFPYPKNILAAQRALSTLFRSKLTTPKVSVEAYETPRFEICLVPGRPYALLKTRITKIRIKFDVTALMGPSTDIAP